MVSRRKLKAYYALTKPGIVYGNALSIIAGFLLAARVHGFVPDVFIEILLGGCLIMAAACVFNNIADRSIDRKMARTSRRPSVTGEITLSQAVWFGSILLVVGLLLVGLTNLLTAVLGVIAFLLYVFVYTPSKKKTPYSTMIGSLPGALPPVAGYTSLTGELDVASMLLFLTLALWQLPHFYSIAIFRRHEYAKAGLPVLTVAKGVPAAKRHILISLVGFLVAAPTLGLLGYAGPFYTVVMAIVAAGWLGMAIYFQSRDDSDKWAKRIFGYSLLILPMLPLVIWLDGWLGRVVS